MQYSGITLKITGGFPQRQKPLRLPLRLSHLLNYDNTAGTLLAIMVVNIIKS